MGKTKMVRCKNKMGAHWEVNHRSGSDSQSDIQMVKSIVDEKTSYKEFHCYEEFCHGRKMFLFW